MKMRLTRRAALKGLMGATISSTAFGPNLSAFAQDAGPPRRLIQFSTGHGTVWDYWTPTGTAFDFTLPRILSPLNALKSKIIVVDGIGFGDPVNGHNSGTCNMFTGSKWEMATQADGSNYEFATGPSVDQFAASRLFPTLKANDAANPSSLVFSKDTGNGHVVRCISYRLQPRDWLVPEQDPYQMFNKFFGGQTTAGATPSREVTRRLDVLANVNADLERLRSRVSSADWQRLQIHADSIADLQRSLKATIPAACTKLSPLPTGLAGAAKANAILDMLVAAMSCGLARIGSFQYHMYGVDGSTYDYAFNYVEPAGGYVDHHSLSHAYVNGGNDLERFLVIKQWQAKFFASLLSKLAAIPEGNGTLLDSTMVVWGSELGDASAHSTKKIPFVIGGGSAGGLKTGQYVKLPMLADKTYTRHNALLVSMLHYMGLKDVQSFGNLDNGGGSLDRYLFA